MSILIDASYGQGGAPVETGRLSADVPPLLGELPKLLEYRAEADPDAEFIPKTVAGFAMGALAMGICLDVAEALFFHVRAWGGAAAGDDILLGVMTRFAFMIGITGVASSLLLVGLKVRADHASADLYARHWLNSIGSGALFALLVWGPWVLVTHSFYINRFVATALWMALMSFPIFAARWTVGPHAWTGESTRR